MTTAFVGNFSDTWNDSGTTFNAIKVDVTDGASASDSTLIDLQVGSTSQFKVDKGGIITAKGFLADGNVDLQGNRLVLDADNDSYINVNGDDSVSIYISGSEVLKFDGAADDKLILDGVSFSPTGAVVGQALGYPNSTTTLEPYTPAGGGDLLSSVDENISGIFAGGQANTIAELAARLVTGLGSGDVVQVSDQKRGGTFVWRSGDQSARVTNDPQQGVWVAPDSDNTGASGAWERLVDDARYNVWWFGAEGDGSTDDTTAIQAAIDWVEYLPNPLNNKAVYLPGDHLISSTLRITDGSMAIIGDGWRASVLRGNSDFGDFILAESSDSSTSSIPAIHIRDFTIRQYADTTNGAGINFKRAVVCKIENIFFRDVFGGIRLQGGNNIYIDQCSMGLGTSLWSGVKSGSYGLKLEEGPAASQKIPAGVFVTSLNARDADSTSTPYLENYIVVNAADGVWLNNCHVLGAGEAGLLIEPQNSDTQVTGVHCTTTWFDSECKHSVRIRGTSTGVFGSHTFANCQTLNAREDGFYIESGCDVKGVNVTGGVYLKADYNGFRLDGGSGIEINGAQITGNGQAAGTYAGIKINTDGVQVVGCNTAAHLGEANSTQDYGVWLQSGVDDCFIVGNAFLDTVTADVFNESAALNNIIRLNHTDASNYFDDVTVSGTELQIPEYGDFFTVDSGVSSFDDISGKQNRRFVWLKFQADCTIDRVPNQLETKDQNDILARSGDVVGFVYDGSDWIEATRSLPRPNLGSEATSLTISSGAVTATGGFHRLAGEGGSADDLDTLNGGKQGDVIVLMAASSSVDITVKHNTGNINLDAKEDCVLTTSSDKLVLINFNSEWYELSRQNQEAPEFINLGDASILDISSGEVTATKSFHRVDTEGDIASDDLDTINGGSQGDMLVIMAASSGRTVSVTESGNIRLSSAPFALDNNQDKLMLIKFGSDWHEVSRSDNGA